MKHARVFLSTVLSLGLVFLAPAALTAQEGASEEELAVPTFRTGTAAVMLDLVVRDKSGRPIRDLKPEEIEVKEDGKRCLIQSFRLLDFSPGAAAPEPAAEPTAALEGEPARVLNLVTLVFDRLRVETAPLARQAALDFVEQADTSSTRIAVFRIGVGLMVIYGYTDSKEDLRTAIDLATSLGTKNEALADAAMEATQRALALSVSGDGMGPGAGDLDYATMQMARVEASALRYADQMQRLQEGQWTLYPLAGLIKAQERLPGRKTVVFFSEGMVIPDQYRHVFDSTIGQANRANVSLYAVDVRGLSGASDTSAARQAAAAAAATSQSQLMKGGGEAISRDEVMTMDTAISSTRMNPQQTLRDLSEDTGGFLIANANDLGPRMTRVVSDVQTHYELTYVSPRPEFDGKLREIKVKVKRKGAKVQTRKGYFAMPPGLGVILPREVPLLSALSSPEPARDFELRFGAFRFGRGALGQEHTLMVDVPLSVFDFEVKKKEYRLDLAIMAMVTDVDGQVVQRVSDEYPLSGPADQLEQVKQSDAVLRRPVMLPPGRYLLESAAIQRSSDKKKSVLKASVARQPLVVPEGDSEGLALGGICLIERAYELPADAEQPPGDPFVMGNMRIVPAFSNQVSKSQAPAISLYALAYPEEGKGASTFTMELLRDGELVGQVQPEVPAADALGRIPFVTSLPTESFEPGQYAVRLSLEQGEAKSTSEMPFELLP